MNLNNCQLNFYISINNFNGKQIKRTGTSKFQICATIS